MAADLSTYDKALRIFYLPTMQKLLNESTILLNRIKKDSSTQNVDGKSFTVAIHAKQNDLAGVGIADGGATPAAGNQEIINAIVPNKYIYAGFEVTGPTIKASKTNAGAFVKVANFETKQTMSNMKRSVNRAFHGNGTGALAYWTTADNVSGTDVDDNQGTGFTHLLTGQTNRCDLVDASDHTTLLNTGTLVVTKGVESATVTAITWATGSVAGSADGDYLVQLGATPGRQIMGLEGIISAGDPPNAGGLLANGLHGLTVAAQPNWAAQIIGSESSKRDVSFADLQRLESLVAMNSAAEPDDIKFYLTSYPTRDKLVELCKNEQVWVNNVTIDGGFKAIEFNGKVFVPDNQCRRGRIYGIVPDALAIFRTMDFDWIDDGSGILRKVAGFDKYEALLAMYGDLACLQRNSLSALIGLND